jgi:hypothetical protein
MIVIGANTPAMIRSMTREVESRNLIVASMHYARKGLTLACAAASGFAAFVKLTHSAITRSTPSRQRLSLRIGTSNPQKNRRPGTKVSRDASPGIFTAAGETPNALWCFA